MIDVKFADKAYIQSLSRKGEDDSAIKFIRDNYGCSYGEARDAVNDIKEQPHYTIAPYKEKERKKIPLAIIPIAVFGVFILVAVLLSYIKPEQTGQKQTREPEYSSHSVEYVATEEDIKECAKDLALKTGLTESARNNLSEVEVTYFCDVEMYEDYHLGIIHLSFYYMRSRCYMDYAFAVKPISEKEYEGACISTRTGGDLYDKLKEIIRRSKQRNN